MENNNVYIGKNGYLFEKYEYGENEKKGLEKKAKIVNEFANKNELPIYFMLLPNSIYIHQDKLPNYVETYNQRASLCSLFWKKLSMSGAAGLARIRTQKSHNL